MSRPIRYTNHPVSQLMKKTGLNQHEFADKVGICHTTVYKIIHGKRDLTYDVANAISVAFEVPINNLFGNDMPEFDCFIDMAVTVYPDNNGGYTLRNMNGQIIDGCMIDKDADKYIRGEIDNEKER